MSQVFKAFDMHLGREVALKVLHQSLSRDSALTAMFEREAKLTASILHPNVVKVFTVGNEDGYFFIAMELVDATSLEQVITTSGALPENRPQSYDLLPNEIIEIKKKFFGFDRASSRATSASQKKPWLVLGTFSALLAVGTALWVYLKDNRTSQGGGEFTVDGGVISAGAESNAAQFLRGRELLVNGEFKKAET